MPPGATKHHGPYLPPGTDTVIAVVFAETVARSSLGHVWAPALPHGSSGEQSGFRGTLSLGQAASEAAVVELVRSADRVERVVLVYRRLPAADRALHPPRGGRR